MCNPIVLVPIKSIKHNYTSAKRNNWKSTASKRIDNYANTGTSIWDVGTKNAGSIHRFKINLLKKKDFPDKMLR